MASGSSFALWDADCDPQGRNQHPTRQMRVLFDYHAVVRLPAKWPKMDCSSPPPSKLGLNTKTLEKDIEFIHPFPMANRGEGSKLNFHFYSYF